MALTDNVSFIAPAKNSFFEGDIIAETINNKNWSTSILGELLQWSPFLISNINKILSSSSPVILLWGSQKLCFYNDAFYKNYGAIIQPINQIGTPAAECLQQLWPTIKPLVNQVMQTGNIICPPPALLSVVIDGCNNKISLNFTVMPIDTTANSWGGVLVCCNEIKLTTALKVMPDQKHLAEHNTMIEKPLPVYKRPTNNFEDLFLQLAITQGGGHLLLSGTTFNIEMANDAYLKLFDLPAESVIGAPFFTLFQQGNTTLENNLTNLLKTGLGFSVTEDPVSLFCNGIRKTIFLNYTYQPCINQDGNIFGIICLVQDVTVGVAAKFAVTENDKQFRQLLMQSPLAIVIFRGSNFIIDTVNTQMLSKFWQKSEKEVLEQPFLNVFPEMQGQKHVNLLTNIFSSGESTHDVESVMQFDTEFGTNTFYVDATYSPLFDIHGKVTGIMFTANDVTLTVKTREVLELQETQLRLTTDANKQATFEMDFTSDTLTHCKNLTKMYGIEDSGKLTHQKIYTYFHPDDIVDVVEKAYITAQITGVLVFDARVIWPDNSIHWIRTHGRMFYAATNALYKMAGTVMDITLEKEKDEYILKLAAIVESSIDAIVSTRIDGTIATWNDAAVNLFGYTALEMFGKPYDLLFETDQNSINNFSLKNNPKQKFSFETSFTKKDNTVIDISCTVSPIKNGRGEIIGISKIARDITRQKRIQNDIITSEAKFRLLAEGMTQLIWTSTSHGVADFFNMAIHRFTGISNEEMQKIGWLQIVHPDEREDNYKKWCAVVAAGLDFTIEHRLLKHDGQYIWHLTRAVPQRDAYNNIISWVGTCTDIHEIKENDQNRDFFISMASHELNTPVTTIKGYVEILIEEYGNKEDVFFTKSITNVHKQIKVLMALITDLLDLSKIKAGVLELYKEHFYSDEFITENLKNIAASHPDYILEFVENEQVVLFADRAKMDRVLINILTNAIKYSPQNKLIKIYCKIVAGQAVISVQDFGIGISKINQQKIFQRFFRISGKSEKTYPGFGIGLFIAAEIMDKHQGKIGVDSVPGVGSVFNFSLPAAKKVS